MVRVSRIYKIIAVIPLVALLATGLSGCSKKSSSSTTTTSEDAVELTIWRATDNEESFQELISAYQEDHPNVTINYVYNPQWKTDPDSYLEQSVNALATGKGPDIWSVRNDWLPAQYEKVRPAPANTVGSYSTDDAIKTATNADAVSELFVPVVSDDVIINSDVYGLPLSVDSLALYINTTIMEQVQDEVTASNKVSNNLLPEELTAIKKILSNGPKDWTELVQVVPYINTAQGTTISRSAIAMGLGSNIEQAPGIISSILLQNGTQIVTDDLKSAYFQNSQQSSTGSASYPGKGAIEFYTNFGKSDNAWYSWNSTDFPSGARQAFMDGKLAMIIDDSSYYSTLKSSNINFNFNITPLPQIDSDNPTTYANYWVETVTNNSKVSEYAWDFLEFATTSNNVSSYLSNTKKPPALLSRAGEYNEDATGLAVFTSQALVAQSWYKGPDPNQTDTIFRNWADNIAVGGKTITEATNTAAGLLTTLLQSVTPPSMGLESTATGAQANPTTE